tara:strand:+ start:220 stop:672 length:453 start_codon:yes stop_codon:yes gene_type:complete
MKKLSISMFIVLMTSIYAEDLDYGQMYQKGINYKMRADLADLYDMCAALYTGIYGFTSNNPESPFAATSKPEDFLKAATTYTLLSAEIKEQINKGLGDPEELVTRTLFYKNMTDIALNDKQVASFMSVELQACRDALAKEAYIEDEITQP